jgi:hypothetical protein
LNFRLLSNGCAEQVLAGESDFPATVARDVVFNLAHDTHGLADRLDDRGVLP